MDKWQCNPSRKGSNFVHLRSSKWTTTSEHHMTFKLVLVHHLLMSQCFVELDCTHMSIKNGSYKTPSYKYPSICSFSFKASKDKYMKGGGCSQGKEQSGEATNV